MRSKMVGFPEFTVSSLRASLIENNHGTVNSNHLPMLYDLCKSGGITDLELNVIPLDKNEEVE